MKVVTNLFLAVLLIMSAGNTLFAQHDHMHKNDQANLTPFDAAMEAYHEVMASTFHPAEDGDLMPLKERSQELVDRSKDWKNIVLPDGMPVDDLRPLLKKLYKESKKVDKLVDKGATDEELKVAIIALHDVFHELKGACSHAL